MYKRIISFFLLAVLIASMFSFTAFAADHQHTFGEVEDSVDLSGATMPNGESLPLGLSITKSPCSTPGVDCDQVRYSWDFFGRKGAFVDNKNLPVAQVILHWYKWNEEFYGKNVGFDKMDASNGGANIPAPGGRNPKGYGDEGKANVNQSGAEILWVEPLGLSYMPDNGFSTNVPQSLVAGRSSSGNAWPSSYIQLVYYFEAPVSGLYYIGSSGNPYDFGTFNYFSENKWNRKDFVSNYNSAYVKSKTISKDQKYYYYTYWLLQDAYQKSFKYSLNNIPIFVEPLGDSSITTTNNITINNNTWNGNIYTDNSTNLTYIYPQYTTINEKNETVTNISNNPLIYNNETKQYYTYDQTTKNYYYITYNAQLTPSPSPTPAPTEKPGGDTGDTTGILAVLVEIRDNMIQGFLDIKAAFVAGFAELSANFTLAIENLNVNIQNVFNKKFPDQSTPETALPSPTPSPSPAPTDPPSPSPAPTDPPSPSPAPDPGKPDSGDKTNNFWTIIFPNGGGSEDGKKGIFWALVSLILALIAFFANLAVGVGYLFPFLPDGVVMTINTCLIVIFLFTIIKFIMRSK